MADEQASPQKQVLLQKVYIKDFSFESPKTPELFAANVNAQTLLNIRSNNREIDAEHFEVELIVAVKAVTGEDTIFLIELVHAGVFAIKGFSPEERFALLGSVCPGTLYAFAREAVADMTNKGGFPPVLLQPIDFNVLYAQNMAERAPSTAPV